MFPSINIQVALQNSNDDDNVRIESDRLEGNTDAIQVGHTVVLTENDVLLGRGGKKNQHAGNEKLRLMATKYSCLYRAALKREKPAIALFLVHLVQSMKPSGRFLKQTGVRGWEIVSEEVAREKVSQCLRDIVKVATPKIGEEGEEPRALTAEAHLSRIELDEANSFVRASTTTLTDQPDKLGGKSSLSASLLKRSRSVPNCDPETERQSCLKRPRQYASLSELGKESFGAYSYRNTTFSALLPHQLPLGDPRLELSHSNYSVNNLSNVKPSDDEYACVNQAILSADQLKNDDSAFHRLIDRMILEEK